MINIVNIAICYTLKLLRELNPEFSSQGKYIFSISFILYLISSVQLLRGVGLFATSWTAARQASLSINNSQNLLKLMSVESVMPSNHLISVVPFSRLQSFPPSGSFPTPQFKSINSSALSFPYSPTLTSICDYWKTRALIRWTLVGKVMSLL